MHEQDLLTGRFEEQRPRLRALAYRMLGSFSDADDAVQEAWIRLNRSDTGGIENLEGWLTTVVSRISLNALRSRQVRQEEDVDAVRMPDPVVGPPDRLDPAQEALVADSVGVALLVVLETLSPAERLAFVLHDVFAVPFADIAAMIDRSPDATRQLASRARRRVRAAAPAPDTGIAAQHEVVEAFFAAGRDGDFERLVSVLHPDVVLRVDRGKAGAATVRGADAVAGQARRFADPRREVRPATINGAAGVLVVERGRPTALMAFTVVDGRVAAIDVLADAERLGRLDLTD